MKAYNINELKLLSQSTSRISPTSDLGKFLIDNTQWLDNKYKKVFPRQRIWHLIYSVKEHPGCIVCNGDVKWDDAQKATEQTYRKYCSKKCQMGDPNFQKLKKQTEIEKYGKGRPSVVKKIKQTNNERYGSDFAIQKNPFKEKRRKTCLQKYGVDNPAKLENLIKKREETNLIKHGFISIAKSHLPEDVIKKIQDKNWLINEHHNNKKCITKIANELNINYEIITRALKRLSIPIIYYPSSILETEINDYIYKIYNGKIETTNKNLIHPKHLDIVIHDKKLAYEINGIYWHSELNGRDRKYHLNKTTACEEIDYNLMHINENEWFEKNNIIKSMIAYSLHSDLITKVYARKCKIVKVSKEEANLFFNENHIQGYYNCSINLGLMYNKKIVSCMSFGKPRYNKKFQYELYRFCSTTFTSVIGGGSKLFKYFINNYEPLSIISYRDKRRGSGNLYQNIGFKYSHSSAPNYWYFKRGQYTLHSRIKFQKHKLGKLLEHFDPTLTEWENMQKNNYDRIWDCGNSVWTWKCDIINDE